MKSKISKATLITGLLTLPVFIASLISLLFFSSIWGAAVKVVGYAMCIVFCIMAISFLMTIILRPLRPQTTKVFLFVSIFLLFSGLGFFLYVFYIDAWLLFYAPAEPSQTILKTYLIVMAAFFALTFISKIIHLVIRTDGNKESKKKKVKSIKIILPTIISIMLLSIIPISAAIAPHDKPLSVTPPSNYQASEFDLTDLGYSESLVNEYKALITKLEKSGLPTMVIEDFAYGYKESGLSLSGYSCALYEEIAEKAAASVSQ